MSQSSIYWSVLHVPPRRIAALADTELNELMRQLLHVQAYRCGCPDASVNTEIRAADAGCDGWSDKPAEEDRWLGRTQTCWQFKTGRAGEPSRLVGEVEKKIPRRTLQQGGRFVVVASGSTAGETGTNERREKLIDAARQAGLPTGNIEVYGSEKLAEWCNQYPAIAARWAGRPEGLWTFDDWAQSEEHQTPYQASAKTESELQAKRAHLDFEAEDETERILHLHVQGQPGVGKTRFALELCRGAPWRDTAIYIRQSDEFRLSALIDSAADAPDVRLMVVADEAQPERLEPLRDSVGRADGRIGLITIGSCHTPDPRRIPPTSVEPLDAAAMRQVVSGWYPDMPIEHVEFVTRFADGYMRLGRLTADAVAEDPSASVPNLLDRQEIRTFLNRLLSNGDRRALYVVAVLTQVGWRDDKQVEGKTIAEHLGLNWHDVQYQVEQFDQRLGIARRGGRYRYVSPNPLGIYLAYEAWETYPDRMKSLPQHLPSESAIEAYYRRLESLARNRGVRDHSRDQLRFFFRVDEIVDPHAARRWSALSAADPELAARTLRRALSDATLDDRRRITFQALGEIVWRLARIASRLQGFRDAATALALLAEAENDTWGNGASREFVTKYQVYLGGTALPYLPRLDTLDELMAQARPALASLVVRALSGVVPDSTAEFVQPACDQVPEPAWCPSTRKEHLECVAAAVDRLTAIAGQRDPALQADLLASAKDVSWLLDDQDARAIVTEFLVALRHAYPELREPLRRQIAIVIDRCTASLTTERRQMLNQLHADFEDMSLSGRLRQYVGPPREGQGAPPELAPLAAELVAAPGLLQEHWSWLTSGEATEAWKLGEALAAADPQCRLAEDLPRLPNSGPDLRVLCGYVAELRETLGDEWYERWVMALFQRDPPPVSLLLEVVWGCGATDRLATMTAELLRRRELNAAIVGKLKYADWSATSVDALHAVLRVMMNSGHRETAIGIMKLRMEHAADEIDRWKPLALELVTDLDLIRCREMPNHYWQRVAGMLVADYAGEIAAAILRAHAKRVGSPSWFLRFQRGVVTVLLACVKRDPNNVWKTLRCYLWPLDKALRFVIGFPTELIERLPRDEILAWIAEPPSTQAAQRAAVLARLTDKHALTDHSLAARIIARYGSDEMVDDAFFSHYVSGSAGRLSSLWQDLTHEFDGIAGRTRLPRMREWAHKSAAALREMIDQQRQHEEEMELQLR